MTIVASPPEQPIATDLQLLFREARQRRRRRWLVAGIVVVILTAGVGVVAGLVGGGNGPANHTTADTRTRRFIPPTTTKGNTTTMLLRLPDGRGYDLMYPKSLDLSQFTLTAGGQVNWPVSTGRFGCCSKYSAPYSGSPSSLFQGKPLAVYRGANGQAVPYYSGTQERYPFLYTNMDYLAFQFGQWTVLVDDPAQSSYFTARMSNDQRASWAHSFDAHMTKGGYLVFRPLSPLRVERGAIDVVLTHSDGSLEISGPVACSASQSVPTVNAGVTAWCDPGAGVRVAATGTASFTSSAASGLRIASLQPVS
jgi:hypothetical protein